MNGLPDKIAPDLFKSEENALVVTLSKLQIANAQLDTSISLYLDGKDLISAITLAGAAEEILGKLVKGSGGKSSLEETVERLCGMYEAAFEESPDPKVFADLRNRTRNELKHRGLSDSVSFDLEREATSMIRRAVANHQALNLPTRELFRAFESELLRRAAEANRRALFNDDTPS